jgi:PIN domain nuclease of toxin-antitoxin system
MKLLLDTHLLLWTSGVSGKLSAQARETIADNQHDFFFSVANIWEVAIKYSLERRRLGMNPRALRSGLLANGYRELTITSEHALTVPILPPIHGDPFDRILISEGLTLLTSDTIIAQYPGPIRLV